MKNAIETISTKTFTVKAFSLSYLFIFQLKFSFFSFFKAFPNQKNQLFFLIPASKQNFRCDGSEFFRATL